MQVCDCGKVSIIAIIAIAIVDAMLTVVVTGTVVVVTVDDTRVIIPPYSPSPSPSSSFSEYVGHHWHLRSRFISSFPPWSSSSSAVVNVVIAIVTINIAIWFVLNALLLDRGSPGCRGSPGLDDALQVIVWII